MNNKIVWCFLCMCMLCGCSNTTTKYIGQKYLGKPYLNNPLGEEKAPDADPLIRFDVFDCTTFVETSLADGDLEQLNQIRYKNGDIDFINRNHFTELDWLNNNKNRLENVSSLYGQTAIRTIVIDKQNWFKKTHNTDTCFEKETINLEYIPYEKLSKIYIQTPLIVLFISDGKGFVDTIGTDLAVTHMGFLLPNNILRHASSKKGCVTDENFEEYVHNKIQNKHNLGIALVKIK